MNMLPAKCPCCDAADPKRIGALPGSEWFAGKQLAQPLPGNQLYRCTRCRLKFRHPLEAPDLYDALYDNAEIDTWTSQVSRPDWDLIIEQIGTFNPHGGRVLDFGCYSGGLLSRLGPTHERFGVEINREAARAAQESSGGRVWPSIEDIPDGLRFNAIVVADVVEHMPNPGQFLERLSSRLEDDGIIIVTTGDADATLWNLFGANWWYCFYPEHISFVSKAWMERALCPHGWTLHTSRRFRYRNLGWARRTAELIFTCVYGLAPRFYLYIGRALSGRFVGRDLTSAPGNGVSADHLLFVLGRKRS